MTMRDHEARTSEITEVAPFDETTLHQARLTVAGNATSIEDATLIMKMLGIHPSQDDEATYDTRPPPLPTSGTRLANPLATNYPHTPPRILRPPHEVQGSLFNTAHHRQRGRHG